ncbi:MAG: sigma-54-dependent transcriptional regulator [Phycisphaerae bacterium]
MQCPPCRRGRILLAEDDPSVLEALTMALRNAGYDVLPARSGRDALRMLSAQVDLLIADLWMPQMDGLALLDETRKAVPALPAVIITGNATVPSAVRAMKLGAFDYLLKPFTPPDLLEVVERAIEQGRLRRDLNTLTARASQDTEIENLIGHSSAMLEIARTIRRVAPFKSTVLVEGESGTGKELVVRAIHQLSPRNGQAFIAFNCAAMPANLVESELFGHERGAFTGAAAKTAGYFEAAHGGTLFIDEVGELELSVQTKLLRALESGKVMPIGATQEKAVDVRVLAATNTNLAKAVEEKRFRADLFYRLNVVRIELPPLRKRPEDIALLTASLVARLADEHHLPEPTIEPSMIVAMQHYHWPGNVRELRNVLESLLILQQKSMLTQADLPEYIRHPESRIQTLDLDLVEREALASALRQYHGDRTAAANALRISVRTLYRKIARYGLS